MINKFTIFLLLFSLAILMFVGGWRNFVGAGLGFVFTISFRKKYIHNLLRIIVILSILIEMMPVSLALADEFHASRKFPILSDFESNLELSRWPEDELYQRNKRMVYHAKSSLSIKFGTSKYSGVSLNYFPDDWSKYQYLKYNIYYPYTGTLDFICRIHDEQHTKDIQSYNDRFNHRYSLHNGWNEISISLEDVKKAPNDRNMDMKKIQGIGIFTVRLPESKKAFLEYVRLEM